MPDTTYYKAGDWNFYCDLCGRKEKSSNAMRTWDGFYVCRRHKEVRNPQDFVRGVADDQTTPWSRGGTPDNLFLDFDLLQENGFQIRTENNWPILLQAEPYNLP